MEIIDIVNRIARISFINLITYMVCIKLINYRDNNYKKMLLITVLGIIETIGYIIISKYTTKLWALVLLYLIHSAIIGKFTNNKYSNSVIVTFISLAITYITYSTSVVIGAILIKATGIKIEMNNIMSLVFIMLIQILILGLIKKIKRFRNGFSFLQNKDKLNNIGIIGFSFSGIALVIFSLVDISKGNLFRTNLIVGVIIEAICLTIWIRRKITKHYKQKLKEQTIEELQNEIKSKDKEITKILEENNTIATINHKYSSRINALEKISVKMLSKPELVEAMKAEFGEEFGELENQIKKLSEEYSTEIKEKVKHENKLIKTGIFGIDNILEYMKDEAEKNNIKFDLKINGNINYMVGNIIDQSKLETLLGDHIKDAIIAIKHSDNTYKSILTTIGIIDECYEIRIYDTGIEFEIPTLLKLGTEAVTTHKETGGSGIGFMTTFETLKETKASLIIEEKHPMNNTDYTKIVAIRFDGKNEYKIKSYRSEEIKKQRNDKRIIVEKLKK